MCSGVESFFSGIEIHTRRCHLLVAHGLPREYCGGDRERIRSLGVRNHDHNSLVLFSRRVLLDRVWDPPCAAGVMPRPCLQDLVWASPPPSRWWPDALKQNSSRQRHPRFRARGGHLFLIRGAYFACRQSRVDDPAYPNGGLRWLLRIRSILVSKI